MLQDDHVAESMICQSTNLPVSTNNLQLLPHFPKYLSTFPDNTFSLSSTLSKLLLFILRAVFKMMFLTERIHGSWPYGFSSSTHGANICARSMLHGRHFNFGSFFALLAYRHMWSCQIAACSKLWGAWLPPISYMISLLFLLC